MVIKKETLHKAAIVAMIFLATDVSAFSVSSRLFHRPRIPHSATIFPRKVLGLTPSSQHRAVLLSASASEVTDAVLLEDVSKCTNVDADQSNISDENVGQRGEAYLLAQGALMPLIVLGGIPFVHDALAVIIGPSLILLGLFTAYLSAKELRGSLSHWSVPVEKKDGGEGLITSGVYSQVRHPLYSGLLSAGVGLAVVTDSATRLALTFLLFYVLEKKATHEEAALEEMYPGAYTEYKNTVKGKIVPHTLSKALME